MLRWPSGQGLRNGDSKLMVKMQELRASTWSYKITGGSYSANTSRLQLWRWFTSSSRTHQMVPPVSRRLLEGGRLSTILPPSTTSFAYSTTQPALIKWRSCWPMTPRWPRSQGLFVRVGAPSGLLWRISTPTSLLRTSINIWRFGTILSVLDFCRLYSYWRLLRSWPCSSIGSK